MVPWVPIVDASLLPLIGTEESEHLDFKRQPWGASDDDKNELLRDVAQFANHLGGSIIIGAEEGEGGRLARFVSIEDPETVILRVRNTCYDRLSPRVVVVALTLNNAESSIVVVNVQPSVGPVAIRVSKEKKKIRWEFCRRYGKTKQPIEFEEVERMWSDGRRGKVLLSRIPDPQLKTVYLDIEVPREATKFFLFDQASTITRDEDYFGLKLPGGETFNFPYEFVKSVWPRVEGGWFVVLDVKLDYRNSGGWVLRHDR